MLASTMQFSNTNQHTHPTRTTYPTPTPTTGSQRFGPSRCLTESDPETPHHVCCLRTQQCANPKTCVASSISCWSRHKKKPNKHSARPSETHGPHPRPPERGALLNVMPLCCSLERRGSSRTFRYG